VQLGGAVKNVLAIAVGIADGLQCGANAQAALVTRGLAEMMRLGEALGAHSETLIGLSGLGDLILTCTNNQSRNRRFGLAMGKGQTSKQSEQAIGQVVEGIKTAAEISHLANQHHVEMPITHQVYNVLYHQLSPQQALHNLLMREPKNE
jgi:glycerol-3-phosphate dehydrogenase (NAD(P)+)